MRYRLLLLLPLFFLQTADAQTPFTRDYSLSEANTDVKVNALATDKAGYIWVGTDAGLMRYNGSTFVKIQDSVRKPVTAIAVSNNAVWAGYSNGAIGRVENSFVYPVAVSNGPTSSVTCLFSNGVNLFVAGTEDQGIFVIMNNVATAVNTSKGLSDNFIYGFSIAGPGRILAGSDVGINDIVMADGKPTVLVRTTKQGLPDNIVSVIKNIPATHQYWTGTQQGGAAIYDGDRKEVVPVQKPGSVWMYGQINDILPVAAGRAWIATDHGYLLEVTKDDSGKAQFKSWYYAGKNFRRLLRDKTGNIWCGTDKGLTLVTGEYIADIKPAGPWTLRDITAMIWDNNSLLVAVKQKLYRVMLTGLTPAMIPVYTAKATITSLFVDKEHRLWIGTLGDGLYFEKGRSAFVKVSGIDELSADASVLSVSGTARSIWVAGLKGVEELSYPVEGVIKSHKHHGKKTGTGSDYVYQLYPDRNGHIWMATDGAGVCMYDGAEYHHWDNSFGQNSKVVYSITEDGSGGMWAGTMYKDLYHLQGNKWENLRLPETQYPDINITAVNANATGQVISVYQRCIDEWYPKSHYFRHFNSAMGMGIDSTSNVLNCVARDTAGNIYIPYQHGVVQFKNQMEPFDIRPDVHIVYATMYSKPVLSRKSRFDHDENYPGFVFDGICFANHERLNYRYQLQGYNDDWIYTNDASVSFPRLSPGSYNFRVQVSLNPAFEHPNENQYSFVIAAPFWKTNWFYSSLALSLLLLVYLYVKLREKRLKSISQLQQERMMFEYEHLKSQVNPHFLFNSLYALSILIEEKKEHALSYTVSLADLYRNMLMHSKQDLITLKEEFDILNAYMNIQQTRFGDAFRVNTGIPGDVMETKKIVPLAVQLLVENAIKHNVVSMAHPLVINITATRDEITVRNVIQPKMSQEKGAGIGLINISQRYKLLTRKPVSYGVVKNEFIVKLPLL